MFKATLAASTLSAVLGAQLLTGKEPIADSYIVVLKNDVDSARAVDHRENVRFMAGVDMKAEYNTVLKGYSAKMTKDALASVLDMDDVDYIEEDSVVYASLPVNDACKSDPVVSGLWGLSRTSNTPNTYTYEADTNGQGVTAYIVDTGINIRHQDFGGRATMGLDLFPNEGTDDGNGHGTHCAGTVGGAQYGIAKSATLIGVKVLSARGSGSTSGVIQGIDYVAEQTAASGETRVANLSLGGGFSATQNAAVNAAVDSGVVMVLAAGNSRADACNSSPAATGGVGKKGFTVMASTVSDTVSGFSNFGSCTDIIAPGSSVLSAWIGSTTATNTISGTSMAAPHVAGVATAYLSANKGDTPAQVKAALVGNARENVFSTVPGTGSPNLLLFNDCA